MLATLAKSPPTGDRWLHEIKFDGYRLQAHIEDGKVSLWTRGGLDWTKKFGEAVPEALRNLPVRTALIDGELVVENAERRRRILAAASRPQRRTASTASPITPSIVSISMDTICAKPPLIRRKALLGELIGSGGGAVRYSSHFEEDGKLVLQRACALGLEGIVSKASQSVYVSGRGKSWVKAKCSAQQEFVIAGYVPSSTGRKAIGSLVAWRLRGRETCVTSGASAPAFPLASPRLCSRGSKRCAFASSPFAKPLTHGRGAAGPLRPAGTHRGDRFPRLDRRRPAAPGVLSGLARR